MENQGNLILIDWLTATSHIDSVDGIKSLLGMDGPGITWETKEAYMNGYPMRQMYGGVNILYGGRDDMGVCLTMSGQGCRTFETYGHGDWFGLLGTFITPDDYNLTRLDLAFDDHTGILDINRLLDDTDDHYYVSRSRWWKVEYGSEGTSIYHGSPKSDVRFRIYDKAAERGLHDGSHWIRVEMQLRDKLASSMGAEILTDLDVGRSFCGVLRNYLTYRDPNSDSNRSRWPLADYWENLLAGAEAIRLWTAPGVEYNIFRLERFLVDQCGAAIRCYNDLYGFPELMEKIKLKGVRTSIKYQMLLQQAGKG